MLRYAIAAALTIAATAAQADVIVDNKLSGTGDNVVFNSLTPGLVIGSFNGQHQGLVDFSCLVSCATFTGAQSGNDIKINNFQTLKVQIFDSTGTTVLPTATDVFSLTGTGDVTLLVTANESNGTQKPFTFDLGQLGTGQNGFTIKAINNESIDSFRIVDTGGTITDFEHYRIAVAAPLAVPAPVIGAGLPGAIGGMLLLGLNWLRRRRRAA